MFIPVIRCEEGDLYFIVVVRDTAQGWLVSAYVFASLEEHFAPEAQV